MALIISVMAIVIVLSVTLIFILQAQAAEVQEYQESTLDIDITELVNERLTNPVDKQEVMKAQLCDTLSDCINGLEEVKSSFVTLSLQDGSNWAVVDIRLESGAALAAEKQTNIKQLVADGLGVADDNVILLLGEDA